MNNLELKTDKLQLLLKSYWPEITFPTNPNYLCKALGAQKRLYQNVYLEVCQGACKSMYLFKADYLCKVCKSDFNMQSTCEQRT